MMFNLQIKKKKTAKGYMEGSLEVNVFVGEEKESKKSMNVL